jgi:DNA primase large subunit
MSRLNSGSARYYELQKVYHPVCNKNIMSRLNSGSARYYALQKVLSPFLK